MAGFSFATFEVSRERLEGLMFFRVVLVTLFLGSALAVDVEALSALSDFKNAVLLGLIIATYGLTIIYAVVVRRVQNLERLAAAQLFIDLAVTTALVATTDGVDSLFLFLFLITIINSAVVLGRHAALICAALTTIALLSLALYALKTDAYSGEAMSIVVYRVALNGAGAFVIAVLSGFLAERLSEATAALEEKQSDIAELRALNANILSSLNSGLITVDSNARIIFFNRAAEQLTGFEAEEMLGSDLGNVFPELDFSGEGSRLESEFERGSGEFLQLGFSVSALRDSNGEKTGNIIIFQDLTEIRALEEEMQRSQRLAAIGELAAGIAHEIRNPLASISGSVEMLGDEPETSEDNRLLLSIVNREVDRLNKLISEFLEYSRPLSLEISSVSLARATREITNFYLQGQPDSEIELDLPADEDMSRVGVDSDAYRQVLWNLLKNGAEACGEANRPVRLFVSVKGNEESVELVVEDDGDGIAEEAASHIFEPFFTTKEKGTGLGLATIFRIIEEHGGTIRYASPHELRGARFEISFPRDRQVLSQAGMTA